jgi:hypothetical protein
MELTGARLADAIVLLVERKYPRLKLTDEDISEMLFGDAYYRPRVNAACRWLIEEKRLSRKGKGVAYEPFWYLPWSDPIFKRRFLSCQPAPKENAVPPTL